MIFEHTNGKKYDIIEVGKAKDMRGTYGDFIVDTRVFDVSDNPDNRHTLWRATCSCGNVEIKKSQMLQKSKRLTCSNCSPTGREHKNKIYDENGKMNRLYSIFMGMKQRTNNNAKSNPKFKTYTEKEISLCEEWKNYDTFFSWAMSNGYSDELTLDRIDNYKGYEPSNCRWATPKEQANNRTSNHLVEYEGKEYTLAQLGELLGMSHEALLYRISANLDLGKPKRKYERMMILYKNEEHLLSSLCKEYGLAYSTVKSYYVYKSKSITWEDILTKYGILGGGELI